VTERAARRFAERVHAGGTDRYGVPLLDHVRRVAAAVSPEARTVAWLHEVLEFSDVTAGELRAAGATEDEVGAVRLLTRDPDGDAFEAHVARIAAAPGRSGELARIVTAPTWRIGSGIRPSCRRRPCRARPTSMRSGPCPSSGPSRSAGRPVGDHAGRG